MGQKGTEKDRIVGKNVIEGRRTDGNRRRRTENVREQNLRNIKTQNHQVKKTLGLFTVAIFGSFSNSFLAHFHVFGRETNKRESKMM